MPNAEHALNDTRRHELMAARFLCEAWRSNWVEPPATSVQVWVAHTGHSSQLFPVATGKNAQFVATVARGLVMGVEYRMVLLVMLLREL